MEKKICKKCLADKLISDFSKNKNTKDGLQDKCKICVKEYKKQYYINNKDKILEKAKEYYIENQKIIEALSSFKGIKRRFSYIIKNDNFVFIDDYAHHPTEINAVYQAVTELYPNKKVLAVFQPHLFSRTRDFANNFAKSLSQFENLLLMDIYPAREKPIDGITSSWLLEKITSNHKKLVQKSDLIEEILKQKPDVLVTIGAGDIGEMIENIKHNLINFY